MATEIEALIYKEQVKHVMNKHGLAWIDFDESSGNAIDKIGGYVGTITNATRVTGWGGIGSAMSFDGTNSQNITFNSKFINGSSPLTIRFKIKNMINESKRIFGTIGDENTNGFTFIYDKDRGYRIRSVRSGVTTNIYINNSNYLYEWVDIFISYNTTTADVYMNNVLVDSANIVLPSSHHSNLTFGRGGSDNSYLFVGQIDEFQIYNKALTPDDFIIDKTLIYHDGDYKKLDTSEWTTVSPDLPSVEDFLIDGMDELNTLDRQVTTLNPLSMTDKSVNLTSNEDGKLFGKTLDLNKYVDIRKIKVGV